MEKDLTTGNITPHLYCFFSCIVYSLHLICSPNPDLNAGGFRDHSYDKTLFKDYFFWVIDTYNMSPYLKDVINNSINEYNEKLLNSNYSKPIIVQNIDNWCIFASDGTCFNQNLIERSEYEKTLK